jgi:hypothetical protein
MSSTSHLHVISDGVVIVVIVVGEWSGGWQRVDPSEDSGQFLHWL